jgi:5'-nucleotidase (lipoprotein e(P4) family)
LSIVSCKPSTVNGYDLPNWSKAWRGILALAVPSLCSAHGATDATLWMQTSAEYRVLVEQLFNQAQRRLPDALAASPGLGAVENQADAASKQPAVILDIDETVLDNGPAQALAIIRGQRGLDPDAWNDWIMRHKADALPGALDYVKVARELGVEVFYVTNRMCSSPEDCAQQDATIRNLTDLGFPDVDDAKVLLKNERPGWTAEKSSRRAEIARDFRIVQLIGDDLGDFVPGVRKADPETRREMVAQYRGRFGHTWYLLPNPLYGSWKKALGGAAPVSHLEPDREQLCLGAYTPIGHIQGPGSSSPCTGLTVTTRGVVTLVSSGKGGLGGYFLQDAEGDNNPATADGIFVFDRDNQSAVTEGDVIRIRAQVTERTGLTALEPEGQAAVTVLDRGQSVRPTPVRLPESFDGELERYEGMLISIDEPMTITGNRWLDDLGQLKLASADDHGQSGRLYQPTDVAVPGSPEAKRIQMENARGFLVLDDGKGFNPDPPSFIAAADESATPRVGDQVAGILGVLDYGKVTAFDSADHRYNYRVQATRPPTLLPRNHRPPAPTTPFYITIPKNPTDS